MSHLRVATAVAVCAVNLLTAPKVAASQNPERAWLVLGDSYSSGEGVQDTATTSAEQRPKDGEKVRDCRRADGNGSNASAWAPTAYRRVGQELRISAMHFLACTGAISDEIPAQIAEAKKTFGVDKWDVVTFSIGGNNIKFADIIKECIGVPSSWRALRNYKLGCKINDAQFRERVDMLAGNVDIRQDQYNGSTSLPSIYDQVAERVNPGGHVIVLGYPNIIEEADRWRPLRVPLGFTFRRNNCELIWRKDVELLRTGAAYLNRKTQDVVLEAGKKFERKGIQFHFLNISEHPYESGPSAGERHSLCTDDQWLYGPKIDRKAYIGKSFHPHRRGYDATGNMLADYMRGRIRFDHAGISCLDVGFTPNSDNGVFDITSTGVPCGDIESILHEIYDGPGFDNSFHVRGFDCRVIGERTEGMIARYFRCEGDNRWFTFTRE